MSELNASNLRNEDGGRGPNLVGITELTSPYYMVPPSGTTEQRPENPEPGTLRFNTDIGSLEYFRGSTLGWEQIQRTTPNLDGGARGIFAQSYQPSASNRIEYITIPTLGNAIDFGNLTASRKFGGAAASRTRGLWAGGGPGAPGQINIDYVTIASTGNAADFGDMTLSRTELDGLSTETRGVFVGGYKQPASRNTMDYITISSIGNAVDFGDLGSTRGSQGQHSGASTTRGLCAGGQWGSPYTANTIEYITVATTGNSAEFGDLVSGQSTNGSAAATTSIKMYMMGGGPGADQTGVITFATLGHATDFGGEVVMGGNYSAGCGSPTRGCCAGGSPGINTIKYIDFATVSDGIDFGDLTGVASGMKGLSNAHGGL